MFWFFHSNNWNPKPIGWRRFGFFVCGNGSWRHFWRMRNRNKNIWVNRKFKINAELRFGFCNGTDFDDSNEKEKNDCRVQAMFTWSRHSNVYIFIISQDYDEIPKTAVRAKWNIHHLIKPNNFRDFRKLYQETAAIDMTLIYFNYLTSILM